MKKTYNVICNYPIGIQMSITAESVEELKSIVNDLDYGHLVLHESLPDGIEDAYVNYVGFPQVEFV